MGAKGQRRREKNYQAAHGGGYSSRLPPPPVASSIDALPSKLRRIMSLAGSIKQQEINKGKRNTGNAVDKGVQLEEGANSTATEMKRKRNDETSTAQFKEHGDEIPRFSSDEKKKKKKKKGKKANDLRFGADGEPVVAGSKRKERKKQLLQARKNKHKRAKTDEDLEFHGCEDIKFGDVVMAPPKLTSVPKGLKTTAVASQERLRLQAVDAYRNRKAWSSRPGVKLPPPGPAVTTPI
ncbi:hypothetical protein ACP275_14G152200 [Erythranthe tilingii]